MTARYLLVQGKDDGRPLPEVGAGEAEPWARGNADADMLLALGLGAGKAKNAARTEEAANRMAKMVEMAEASDKPYQANYYSIMLHELKASAAMVRGETDEALKQLNQAVELEDKQDPPSGPAGPIKPSHELYGEFLVKAGKYDEAIEVLRVSLQRTPNRTAALLALARAADKSGDVETATQSYETLQRFLKDADDDVPFLDEVRNYGSTTDDASN